MTESKLTFSVQTGSKSRVDSGMATPFSTDRAEYERLSEIFERIIALAPAERGASLEKLCAGDPDLLAKMRLMLEKHIKQDSFLDHPALGVGFTLETSGVDEQVKEFIGREIAGCTITRLISAGGMGIVYEAQQHNPRRRVAIKMMRAGLWSRGARDRFSHEVNALGRLRHSNIAQIHQSGLIEDGASLPYFVMEFVEDAQSITQWAQEHHLSEEAKLKVFLQSCDAVQHGHQHSIIHRDLKPENILIGSDGQVKVIDFGVAKATESDLSLTMNTAPGQLVGTLQYMSPEQCAGDPLAIDTRTDVYALGLVLHELIHGRLPYNVSSLTIHQAIHLVCNGSWTTRGLSGISSEIGLIIAKAIEPEREQRYQSVEEFAADLRRYINHQPISARPPSAIYQLRKFTKRNRGLTIAVLSALFALFLGAGVSIYFAINATRERGIAIDSQKETQRALEETQAVSALMLDIMQQSLGKKESIDTLDLLFGADRFLKEHQFDDPLLKATLHEYVGSGFMARYSLKQAEFHLGEALRIRRQAGIIDESLANCLYLNARLRINYTMPERARPLLREMLEVRRQFFGDAHMQRVDQALRNTIRVYLPDEPEGRAEIAAMKASRDSIRSPRQPRSNLQQAPDNFPLIFEEDFNQKSLDNNWELSTTNVNSFDLQINGSLKLADLSLEAEGKGYVTISRTFQPLSDFTLVIDLSWNTSRVTDMCDVAFELVGHDGNVMLHCGYTDGWIDWYGALSAMFYPTQTTRAHNVTTGSHSMPLAGEVSFEIVREGELTTIFRDGKEFAIWTTTESLTEIRIKMVGTRIIEPSGRRSSYAPVEVLRLKLEGKESEN